MNIVKQAAGKISAYNEDFCFSDHASSIFPLNREIDVLSWNILTKCRFNYGRTNNSYNINENDEQYRRRLEELARAIQNKLTDRVAIIALQEAPKAQELLQILLPDGWRVAGHQDTECISSATATFYDPAKIKVGLGELPHSDLPQAILDKQRGRFHVLQIGEITLINAHFRAEKKAYISSQFTIVEALLKQARGKLVIMGDFNDRLANFNGRKLVTTGGAFKNTAKTGADAIAQIDMAVYNYDPADIG